MRQRVFGGAASLRAGLAGAAAVVVVSGLVCSPVASAGPVPVTPVAERCSPGWVCGWTSPGYTGVVSLVAEDMPWYPETTAYVGFNDGQSVWNGSGTRRTGDGVWGRCVTVYSKTHYGGAALTVRPGRGIERLPAAFGHVRSNRFHTCRAG
ncbi:peptidase inhibitor family I36 protein [Streptomyces sp. NPDC089799]|uniref:peptidase inhibitor family I36 protein n=1 Tax=Streptomyces sp. NPDC089799 TaxID=3155066 RepID=UPI003427F3C2